MVSRLVQVCYDVNDIAVRKRELRALLHASRELRCDNLLVITADYDSEESVEWFGIKRKVRFIPLWKWMLNV